MRRIVPDGPAERITARDIARGKGWRIREVVCRHGPRDRAFEERHDSVSIAAVVAGSFQYRTDAGRALLAPGSFLLGDAGRCFECGHDHATGDRCVAFHFAPDLFAEIAATAAGSARFRFPAAMLPAGPGLAAPAVEAAVAAAAGDRVALDALAMRVADRVLRALSGSRGVAAAPSARDQRRISAALRHIEENADQPLDLDGLAGVAGMSKYHFLRCFRRAIGETPYAYLLGVRLRRAAERLRTTAMPVSSVAFDAGFGDLSTFNERFRTVFGATPAAFRKTGAGRPGKERRHSRA
jgi:AraC-like DNA-binding protein